MENKIDEKKAAAYRVGLAVLILLMVLTIGEFFLGKIAVGWTWPLWGIAIIKAFFIVRDYMHLPRLFDEGQE